MVRDLAVVAQAQGIAIGQDGASFLRDAVGALLDLEEYRGLFGERLVCFVMAYAQFPAEAHPEFFFPIATQFRRVIIQAGDRVAPILNPVFVGYRVAAQRRLEPLSLL